MMILGGLLWIASLSVILSNACRVLASCLFTFESKVSKRGNFSSLRFPAPYPSDLECHYRFEGGEHEGLRISFHFFDLEPPFRTGCLMDYVDISTITMHNDKHLVGRYCGQIVPSPLLSMHPKAEIVFRSNQANQHRGFHAMYEFVDEVNIPPPTSTSGIEGCGGLVSGVGGIITSPGFPNYFPGNVDCLWLIRVNYSRHIYVRILELQLQSNIGNCEKAEVGLYDGYSSFSFNPRKLKKYCGDLKYYKTMDDRTFLSLRNRVVIRFSVTDASRQTENAVGFKLLWTEVAFEEMGQCSHFTCRKSEYCLTDRYGAACSPIKLFCIDQSLVCDGLPNCSDEDESDEDHCNYPYLIAAGVGIPVVVICIIAIFCALRRHIRVRKSASQTQALTMQLRQLEHSPSCSNRQLSGSFSQPCDLLTPAVLEVNGSPGGATATGLPATITAQRYGHYDTIVAHPRCKCDPTDV